MGRFSTIDGEGDPTNAKKIPLDIPLRDPQFMAVAYDEVDCMGGAKRLAAGTKIISANLGTCFTPVEFLLYGPNRDRGRGQRPSQSLAGCERAKLHSPAENARHQWSFIGFSACSFLSPFVRVLLWSVMLATFPTLLSFAETIDRIVAVVNNQIITLGDLEEEVKFYHLDRHLQSSSQDSFADEKALQRELVERMIEKLLMSEQILGFPGSKISEEEIESQLNAVQEKWGGKDSLDRVLGESRTTREKLKEHLRWQILVLKYVDNRFRQFASIDSSEIATYYQKTLVPELERKGIQPPPPPSEVEGKIRELLTEEKVNQAIDEWLASLKETANIHIFE